MIALLLALAVPQATTSAQTLPPLAPVVVAPDPARLAAAKPVIDAVWPSGTYARIMKTAMDQVASTMLPSMMGMKLGDLVPPAAGASTKGGPPEPTLGQTMASADPHFQERTDITMRVMGEEMAKLMTEIEPGIREALAASYARRFTVAELRELDGFFRTPTGRAYAADSMLLMMSPEMMQQMMGAMPRMIAAMPGMMAKVDAATKHLPPPPRPKLDGNDK